MAKVFNEIAAMRQWSREARRLGASVGLVPTMGALHRGHQRLIASAREANDVPVVSIFVNPLQFGPGEDFDRYPRMLDQDIEMAENAGAAVVFAPSVATMYPNGAIQTRIEPGPRAQVLCGVTRPTHFSGVATVVVKLLNIVEPDSAYFGAKDAQQLAVIRHVVRDLDLSVRITGVPTVREPDGLALSSRNRYLSDDERPRACALFGGLEAARLRYAQGERSQEILKSEVLTRLKSEGVKPEYIELRQWDTLEALPETIDDGPVLLALAAWLGKARLIDNVILGEPSVQ
jgi:pantoate--beta-alanine ligase